MYIKKLNIKKYKRFFAFGCSVTNYKWLTWADIIGYDIDLYENWAEPGGGNSFIFNSIIEADTRYNFTKNDLIIISWSNKEREDRYVDNKWIHDTASSINQRYGKDWVNKFYFDSRSFLIRDLAYIKAIQIILNSKSCDWGMLVWDELFNSSILRSTFRQQTDKEPMRETWRMRCKEIYLGNNIHETFDDRDVIKLYQDVFKKINGVYRWFEGECIEKENQSHTRLDDHPTPKEALMFLDWVWPNNTISQEARNYALQYNYLDKIKRPKIIRL